MMEVNKSTIANFRPPNAVAGAFFFPGPLSMALLAIGRWLDAPAVCSMLPAPRSGLLSLSIAGAAFLCYSNAKATILQKHS
jgi:hypothetical protein